MRREEALREFEETVLPPAWNNFVDALHKERRITDQQYLALPVDFPRRSEVEHVGIISGLTQALRDVYDEADHILGTEASDKLAVARANAAQVQKIVVEALDQLESPEPFLPWEVVQEGRVIGRFKRALDAVVLFGDYSSPMVGIQRGGLHLTENIEAEFQAARTSRDVMASALEGAYRYLTRKEGV